MDFGFIVLTGLYVIVASVIGVMLSCVVGYVDSEIKWGAVSLIIKNNTYPNMCFGGLADVSIILGTSVAIIATCVGTYVVLNNIRKWWKLQRYAELDEVMNTHSVEYYDNL